MPLDGADRVHRHCCNRLIAGLGQLHIFATGGFREVFAHAAADELALGVDHQQLQAQLGIAARDFLELLFEIDRRLTFNLGLAQ